MEVGVPQCFLRAALANLILLQVVLARALQAASLGAAHNVDFVLAQQPLDAGRRRRLVFGNFDAYPVTFGVQSLACLGQFLGQG
ncbi:hypothetical protein D3C71_1737300 [compost metagenome]